MVDAGWGLILFMNIFKFLHFFALFLGISFSDSSSVERLGEHFKWSNNGDDWIGWISLTLGP